MNVIKSDIPYVLIVEPTVFGDARGFLYESYNAREFAKAGISQHFVQDNHSRSARGVLRGLHYQVKQPQGKLVRVIAGEIFDVAVACRRSSATFALHIGTRLSAENRKILWIPVGFAHGFLVLSEHAIVLYKTTDYYAPEHERTIVWNDPELGVRWPLEAQPIVSEKDRRAVHFRSADLFD